jgi:ubiquinone biosynthesis monooxygenase Coq7
MKTGCEPIDVVAMLRVDHAGEYGATRIYAGQRAVMGDHAPGAAEIALMARQEEEHLRAFDDLLAGRRIAPTMLMPLWHVAGFVLGAASALAGPKTAMAITAAVEAEIDRHYSGQIETLEGREPALAQRLERFRADERAHRQSALDHGAADAPGYGPLSAVVRAGCRAAIHLSRMI